MTNQLQKKGKGILLFLIIVCVVVGVLYMFRENLHFEGAESIDAFEKKQTSKDYCVLSACNCECYIAGTEPDMDLGNVCTKDCRAWENIDHCKFQNNTCVKVYKRDTGVLTRQIFFNGNRYVPTDRIEASSGFYEYTGQNVEETSEDSALGFEIWHQKADPNRIYIKKEILFHVYLLDNDPYYTKDVE